MDSIASCVDGLANAKHHVGCRVASSKFRAILDIVQHQRSVVEKIDGFVDDGEFCCWYSIPCIECHHRLVFPRLVRERADIIEWRPEYIIRDFLRGVSPGYKLCV